MQISLSVSPLFTFVLVFSFVCVGGCVLRRRRGVPCCGPGFPATARQHLGVGRHAAGAIGASVVEGEA